MLSGDGNIQEVLSECVKKLERTNDGIGNQAIVEVFLEAKTESDAINRLCGILAHTPHHNGIVSHLKGLLANTWRDITSILESNPGQSPWLIQLSKEAHGRYLVNF